MKVTESIRAAVAELPAGEPFTPAEFLRFGKRAAVDQALSRLVKTGYIERVTRGVFVRPRVSRFVGKVLPEPAKVAAALASARGASIAIHGAEAARRFELTTQMPTQPVFCTSGRRRHFRLGALEVRIQHVSPRKLALAGRPAGEALSALWYLGKHEVNVRVIEKLRRKLPAEEFRALKESVGTMPAWMAETILQHEREYGEAGHG